MARKRDCNCGCHLATLSSVKGSRQYHPALYLFIVGKHNLGSCKQIELIWQSTVGRESYTPIEPSQFSLTKFLICFVLQMNNFYNLVFSLILLPLFYVLAYFEKQRKLEYHISQNIRRNWKAETFTHN